MPRYRVEFRGATFASVTVEAGDEYAAAELAFADGEFPHLCAQCSGWKQDWSLEIPDDPACWEQSNVREENG